MVFSTYTFLSFFLPVSFLLCAVTPKRFRMWTLIVLSFVFYIWGSLTALPVLLFSIIFNYLGARLISRAPVIDGKGTTKRKLLTGAIVGMDLVVLAYFKYPAIQIGTPISMPAGLSFFTFQAIAYIIDTYRGEVEPRGHAKDFLFYMVYFPKLVMGPITPYNTLISESDAQMKTERTRAGLLRFCFGLAKKVMIADVIGFMVSQIWESLPQGLTPLAAWLGAFAYSFQLYFDFSGYSDMAIGISQALSFRLTENFNYPYIADSVTDFWRRWHISLSTWFRRYLYIPLGGNRTGHTYRNLLIVFIATGVWHGSAPTYLIWGLSHGVMMLIERRANRNKWFALIPTWTKRGFTFLYVTLTWVLFYSEGWSRATLYYRSLFGLLPPAPEQGYQGVTAFLTPQLAIVMVLAALLALPIIPSVRKRLELKQHLLPWVRGLQIAAALTLLILSYISIANSSYSPFIYFQF